MIIIEQHLSDVRLYDDGISPTLNTATGGGRIPMILAYNQISQSAGYKKDETSVSITVCGGSYGGAAKC